MKKNDKEYVKTLKFIADVNIEKAIIDYLKEDGYDVKWIPEFNCEMHDEDLLKLAKNEKRILITNDKDFGELVFLQKKLSAGLILMRVKGQRAHDKVKLITILLQNYSNKLSKHYTVVTEKNIRFISLEDIK